MSIQAQKEDYPIKVIKLSILNIAKTVLRGVSGFQDIINALEPITKFIQGKFLEHYSSK